MMNTQAYFLRLGKYALYCLLILLASRKAIAQPINDACSNAIILSINEECMPQVFSNVGATQSEAGDVPDCFNGGAIDRDVWFTFSLPINGAIENVKITVATTAENSIVLPQVALYRGACEEGELSFVGLCASAENEREESLELKAVGLTTSIQYFIRVNDFSETATPNWGDFSICVEILPPVFNMGEVPGTNLCAGTLFDSGGPTEDYGSNEDETFTICPSDFNQCIQINVVTYDTERNFDQLSIFDGEGPTAELLRTVSGEGFQTVANSASDCVTISFTSDFVTSGAGFELTWQCTPSTCPRQEERSCADPYLINSLPFEATNLTTCFSGNNVEDGPCSNDDFLAGEDYIFAYSTNGDECISLTVTGVVGGTGVSVVNGCPSSNLAETVCFAQDSDVEDGVLTIDNISLRDAGTYYLIIANEDNCTPLSISVMPSEDCPMVFPSAALCNSSLLLNGCDVELPVALTVEPGQGEIDFFQVDVNNGCWDGVLETNYTWFTFEAQADGEFAFILSNNIEDESLDVDFNIWGPFQDIADACAASNDSQPIRSSWADDLLSDITGLTNVNPILGTPVTSTCQGALSDGFVRPIDVKKGEVYVVLVNDFDGVIFNGAVAIDFSESSSGVLGEITETVSVSDNNSICIGESTALNATGGSLYEWFPKEGLSCTRCPNPIASPSKTTTYTVNVNTVCSTTSRAVTIEVYNADIDAVSEVCMGEVLSLNVSDSRENVQFEWMASSADNPLSCLDCPNPTITANTIGTYEYIVLMTTPLCEIRDTYQLTVREGMAFEFAMQEDQSVCSGTSLELGGVATAGNQYIWTTEDGTILSNTSNLQVTPDTTTTYFLAVENESCAVPVLDSLTVQVSEPPIISLITDTIICQGTTLRLGTFQEQEGVVYDWSAAASTYNSTEPLPIITAETTSDFTLTASNGGCSNTASVNVEVIPIEITFQQEADSLELCLGEAVSLNPLVTPADLIPTINSTTQGLDTTIASIELLPPTNENYIATISNAGCTASDTLVIQVDSLPQNMQIMPSDTTVCEGTELIIQSPLYDPIFYPQIEHLWMPDAGFETPDSLYNLVLTATDSIVLLRINKNGACVDTSIAPIYVNPVADIIIEPIEPICVGSSLNLLATISEEMEATGYEWFLNGASIDFTDTPTLTIEDASAGDYSVNVLGACPSMPSPPVTLTILEVPEVSALINPIPDLQCGETMRDIEANLPNGLAGTWSSPNGNLVFASPNNPITMVAGLGVANTVIWTLFDPLCGEDVSTTTASINLDPASIGSLEDIPDVLTPNNDGFNDALQIPAADCRAFGFRVFNRWGDCVFETDRYNNNQAWEGTHNGDPLPPGPYYYVFTDPDTGEKRSGCVSINR